MEKNNLGYEQREKREGTDRLLRFTDTECVRVCGCWQSNKKTCSDSFGVLTRFGRFV